MVPSTFSNPVATGYLNDGHPPLIKRKIASVLVVYRLNARHDLEFTYICEDEDSWYGTIRGDWLRGMTPSPVSVQHKLTGRSGTLLLMEYPHKYGYHWVAKFASEPLTRLGPFTHASEDTHELVHAYQGREIDIWT